MRGTELQSASCLLAIFSFQCLRQTLQYIIVWHHALFALKNREQNIKELFAVLQGDVSGQWLAIRGRGGRKRGSQTAHLQSGQGAFSYTLPLMA